MTREAEAAFKAWIVSVGGASLDEAYSAGHAAADTDATRKLARMVERLTTVARALKLEGDHNEEHTEAEAAYLDAASRILAIVEE